MTKLLILLTCIDMAIAADLSPATWPPDDKARAERQELTVFPAKVRVVEGRAGLVTATLSPIAIHAGMEALKQGGSAADAAATIAVTQIATALGSYVSYAGILQLIYYDSHTRELYSLDAGWNSYLGETKPATIPPNEAAPGAEGRKTLVPGFMAGIEAMHKRFGRLPFQSLFQPAIWYAENGVTVSPLLGNYFPTRRQYLSRTPEGRNFLHQAGGDHVPKAGDRFVQADLARTLRSVARHGTAYMYTGEWGRAFVAAVRREGGQASLEDLRRYRPTWDEPRSTTFLDRTVYAPAGANEGGRQIVEALNLIEEMRLDRAQPYFQDWTTFRDLTALLQFVELGPYTPAAVADFERRHGLQFSQEDRATKAYARAMAPLFETNPPRHSDAIVVADRYGNVAAMVHSINAVNWGTTGIVVGGIPIPDPAGFQQPLLAAIHPGDRLPNDMAPVIVVHDAKPVMAIASVGSSLLGETVRILLGTFGSRLDLQTVMEAPPLLYNYHAPQAGDTALHRTQFVPEGAYPPDFLNNLADAGVKTESKSKRDVLILKGTAVAGAVNAQTGAWRAIETPALFDFADAY
ncbi:MAG: gamma-glutamyltransferase [Bryobacteraceae bacterium]|jgi:gamma-glutamyltranspeptidase/glutathione hydrolase